MTKPINIRAVASGIRGPVEDTEKVIVKFSKFIRRNDTKLRNFKFPSRNRMKYLKTLNLTVLGKHERGGFALGLPNPFRTVTEAALSRILTPLAVGTIFTTAGAWLPALVPELINEQERKTAKTPGSREEKLRALYEQKKNLKWWDWITGVAQEVDEQIYFLETGQTKSYGKNLTPRTPSDFDAGEWTERKPQGKLDLQKFASSVATFDMLASRGVFTKGLSIKRPDGPAARGAVPSQVIPTSGILNAAQYGGGGLHPFPGGSRISSDVGMRNGKYHWGTDMAETMKNGKWRPNPRTPIVAMHDGVVLEKPFNNERDAYLAGVMINHPDLKVDARYLHMNPSVQPGETVKRGQIIGTLVPLGGAKTQYKDTHLHLELYRPGTSTVLKKTEARKFLGGLHKVPFADVNNATKLKPRNQIPDPSEAPKATPSTQVIPTQKNAKESKKKLRELATQIEELKSSRDMSRVDEKVRIPEVGTYVFGTNWLKMPEDKYFNPNGEQISREEFEKRFVTYAEKLEQQSTASSTPTPTPTPTLSPASPNTPSPSIVTDPSTANPTKRERPSVETYPSYNRPNRVNNTIITNNQLPDKKGSVPQYSSRPSSSGGGMVYIGSDLSSMASSILLTQLSGS